MGEGKQAGELENEALVEGLNKQQAEYVIENLAILRKKYTANNETLNEINGMVSKILELNGFLPQNLLRS